MGDRSGKGEPTNERSGLQEFVLTYFFLCYSRIDISQGFVQCVCVGMCQVERIMSAVVASERSIKFECREAKQAISTKCWH